MLKGHGLWRIRYNSESHERNYFNMDPREILDRNETCQKLGISRQTLLSWIRKGKLKVWKRVGSGSNSALLFTRVDVEALQPRPQVLPVDGQDQNPVSTAA